jgi:cytochrome c peroxidase
MHPGADEVYGDPESGLFRIVERIRDYVRDDYTQYTLDVIREVERVEAYIGRGIEQFEQYLARHAEFQTFLEGGTNA